MKVLLIKDVAKIGKKGSIVEVSDGYGRNFLLPKGLAVTANEGEIKHIKDIKKIEDNKKEREKERNQKIVEELNKYKYDIKVNSGEKGKLFGSITSLDLIKRIKEVAGIEFDKKWFDEKINLKEVGSYRVKVKLSQGVKTEIIVNLVPIEQ
ncbi:MAG: 50S ribosomal protein L9 [Thermotogae bacterium]|nr:50S ribosomal protein L9 [Thermotogota bacterium]HOO75237.1 50S ribosomal protein L9 [Tepiditoga sp.]